MCRCSVQLGVTLDIQFEVSVVAGAPASWSVGIIERFHTTTAPAGAGRQQEGDLSMVPCGKPFTLEIEALDVNHNRRACNPKRCIPKPCNPKHCIQLVSLALRTGPCHLSGLCQSIQHRPSGVCDCCSYCNSHEPQGSFMGCSWRWP
jgi:hypothetical protein